MADDDTEAEPEDDDKPSLRQRLHSATGDRDAEAEALAERAPDVTEEDAKEAVRRAAGDFGADELAAPHDIATTDDARAARDERPD